MRRALLLLLAISCGPTGSNLDPIGVRYLRRPPACMAVPPSECSVCGCYFYEKCVLRRELVTCFQLSEGD